MLTIRPPGFPAYAMSKRVKRAIGLILFLAWMALVYVGTKRQWMLPLKDPNTLNYALSTIAQCAAALAALIGFLGLWRLDRLRDEAEQVYALLAELVTSVAAEKPQEADRPRASIRVSRTHVFGLAREIVNDRQPGRSTHEMLLCFPIGAAHDRWDLLYTEQGRLRRPLIVVLAVTLLLLILSITGFVFILELLGCPWTPSLIMTASLCLGMGPAYVLYHASQSMAPLEPELLMYFADKRKYDATQIMLARLAREYRQRPPTDNFSMEDPGEGREDR
jgi:hypothetical protein